MRTAVIWAGMLTLLPGVAINAGAQTLQNQTINFTAPANTIVGAAASTLVATASSGLPVSFTSATPTICTVAGSSVTPGAVGTCTIAADQSGNASYSAAPEVTQSFAVNPVLSAGAWTAQTIASSNTWNKVAYGNGTYVTLSWTASVGAYSHDGITWTQSSIPAFLDWVSIAYGNGLFVAPGWGSNDAVTSPDGINWTNRTLPATENWNAIAYGNGIFVAAAVNSSAAAMSTDGINWTATTMPGSGWTGIVYGNGHFVAVASGANVAATSVDGINWVQQTLPASVQWQAITYGNGVFVAIAQGSSIVATSPDGVSWTQAAMPESATWSSIAYGEGLFVAVAGAGDTADTTAATSPDGIHWSNSILPTSSNWTGVVFANHQFVAVAEGTYPNNAATMQVVLNLPPPTVTVTSPSSGTWSQSGAIPLTAAAASNGGTIAQVQFFSGSTLLGTATQSPYTVNWSNVAAGTYSITAVATDSLGQTTTSNPFSLTVVAPITISLSSPTNNQTMLGSTPLTITATVSDSVNSITQVAFYNGTTLLGTVTQAPYSLTIPNPALGTYSISAQAIDSAGFIANSSAATLTVESITSPGAWVGQTIASSNTWNKVAYGNGTYVTLSWTASVGAYSHDGITWTQSSIPAFLDWVSIAYGNGLFVAPGWGSNDAVASPDGINWTNRTLPATENWNAIAYGNGIFVAAAANSSAAAMSTDGINWTATTMPGSGWTGIVYGNGHFVAVASGANLAASSTDGINWVQQTLPASAQWQAITYGNGVFVAIARGSSIAATSADGITWTQAAMPESATWSSIAYGEGLFVAVAGAGDTADTTAATSPDGIHWSNSILPTSSNWTGVVFANHQFVAVAEGTYPNNAATMQVVLNLPPPTVTVTSPSSGTWSQSGAIPLTAAAASNGGTIAQVQFFSGSTLLGTATQSPYTVNWSNVAAGTYSITAVATDSMGSTTTSTPVTVTVGPTISLTSPAAGQTFTAPARLNLTAVTSDPVGKITQVAFFNGTSLMGTTTQAPYSIIFPGLEPGTYNFSAQATDSAGLTVTSSQITVTVVAGAGTGGGTGTSGGELVYDIHTDQLNTPRMITDQNGNAVWQWDNTDPFGNNLPNQDPNGSGNQFVFNLRFAGQTSDVETGTYYNYMRDYDPATGRYIESDPIGLRGGQASPYAYVGGNPLTGVDPSGLIKWTGTSYNFSVVDVIGASFTELDLWSQCGADGKRWHIIVTAVGPSVGLGVKVAATISDVSFDDGAPSANPDAFNGWYKGVSAGITVGATPFKSAPSVGFGKAGLGVSQGIGRYGDETSDFSPVPSTIVGRDSSVSGTIGSSRVTFAESMDCTCKK